MRIQLLKVVAILVAPVATIAQDDIPRTPSGARLLEKEAREAPREGD